VKKLRRLGIAEATAANASLETTYLVEHNARFAQASRVTLDRVLQLEETRFPSLHYIWWRAETNG